MPVWTSSKTSARAGARRRPRGSRRSSSGADRVHAGLALDGLDQDRGGVLVDGAGDLASASTARKPGTSGANGACLASCGVADSAP